MNNDTTLPARNQTQSANATNLWEYYGDCQGFASATRGVTDGAEPQQLGCKMHARFRLITIFRPSGLVIRIAYSLTFLGCFLCCRDTRLSYQLLSCNRITRDPMTLPPIGQIRRLMASHDYLTESVLLITPPSLRWLAQVSRT